MPRPPGKHGHGKGAGEQHVCRSATAKSNDGRRRSCSQRRHHLRPRTKPSHEEKHHHHQRRSMGGCGNARYPVLHPKNPVAVHDFPVQEGRLFQPGVAIERGNNPVMPGKHLARDLCVSRLIRSYQPKRAQPEEKEEGAHKDHHRKLQNEQSSALLHEGNLSRITLRMRSLAAGSGPSRANPLAHWCPPPPNSAATAETFTAPLLRMLTRTR